MKKTKAAFGLLLASTLVFSCSNDGKLIERLQQQNDSLSQVSVQQQDVIDGLASTMRKSR